MLNLRFFNCYIATIIGIFVFHSTLAEAVETEPSEITRTHRFEHSSSWKKPSSESHRWSYERACNNCLGEVEKRHGVDWKVTDVEFEDKGRTTKTSQDWRGRRTWKCTHTVVAEYNIVHRGAESDTPERKILTNRVKITYKMLNPFYNGEAPAERSVSKPEVSRTHRFEHSSSWKKPSSESHRWSYERACNNCLGEVEKRHGVDWKVTDVEFEDKGRTTKTSQDWRGRRTWKCTHTVVAEYNIVHRGAESASTNQEIITTSINITYKMRNSAYEGPETSHAGDNPQRPTAGQEVKPSSTPHKSEIGEDLPNVKENGSRGTLKETGYRFRSDKQKAWEHRHEELQEKFTGTKAKESPKKAAIPTDIDLKLMNDFTKLSQLPPIETYFFDIPETVCFPDDRLPVENTTATPWNANCQLIITFSNGAQARGTGWLMGTRTVVTAGHCVHEGADGEFFERIEVIPGMNGPLRPFGSQVVGRSGLRASNEWKEHGNIGLDYGVIILNHEFRNSSGLSPGQHSIAVLTDSQLDGLNVYLSGYPGDKDFGYQWTDSDPISTVQPHRILYSLDTYGGQSGSAVIPIGESGAVGIHNYGGCPNKCTRITANVKSVLDAWLAESNSAGAAPQRRLGIRD